MAKAKSKPGNYPPAEANKRRDDALRAALSMPAVPRAESGPKKKAKPPKASKKA